MSTLLYQQANIEIWWDDQAWLYVDWIGMQSVINIHDGCEQLFRLLQIKSANSVLNDNTRLDGIWIGAAEWGRSLMVSRNDPGGRETGLPGSSL